MSYDFEEGAPKEAPRQRVEGIWNPSDLETIVTLMEVGAILLTPQPGAQFTLDQLFACAKEMCEPGLPIRREDFEIVVRSVTFLRRSKGLFSLR